MTITKQHQQRRPETFTLKRVALLTGSPWSASLHRTRVAVLCETSAPSRYHTTAATFIRTYGTFVEHSWNIRRLQISKSQSPTSLRSSPSLIPSALTIPNTTNTTHAPHPTYIRCHQNTSHTPHCISPRSSHSSPLPPHPPAHIHSAFRSCIYAFI